MSDETVYQLIRDLIAAGTNMRNAYMHNGGPVSTGEIIPEWDTAVNNALAAEEK